MVPHSALFIVDMNIKDGMLKISSNVSFMFWSETKETNKQEIQKELALLFQYFRKVLVPVFFFL